MTIIQAINQALDEYFALHKSVNKIPAKDLMPWFIKKGIFKTDHRNGLPIRKILRELDRKNELHKIPRAFPERKAKNTNWFFVRDVIPTAPRSGTKEKESDGVAWKSAKPVQEVGTLAGGDLAESFPPVVGRNPRVLVLGTMPGAESLRRNEYYANPRNSFWKIAYSLFEKEPQAEYNDKLEFLKQSGIALWDVCQRVKRKGSLDSDITNEIPNDLKGFVAKYPSIEVIAFNGQKAASVFHKHFDMLENIRLVTLPSTSPANASYTFEDKLRDWSRILN